ncbi:uncharacterized protein A4U43_C08F26160 [Asparagus officinalis]|uniref:basic blue protein-like n=1 Tax=Asparagus officinalis TaxID=4686 RepID=UPI00098DFFC4|nr:basic blue protein-like [Asparagus officinalis]ONK61091.1 uncharacterized protein A4U43_C08F26160 [Asparagus officinalis]
MAVSKVFLFVTAMAIIFELATARNITVGSPGGSWDLQTNLGAWAQGQTFDQGDDLVFSYDPSQHDVLEVNKANYDSCTTSNPIATHTSGDDVIPLSTTGMRYFICGKPGHCGRGMKVAINTVASSGPSPPGTPVRQEPVTCTQRWPPELDWGWPSFWPFKLI